jgi:hypothetical protein
MRLLDMTAIKEQARLLYATLDSRDFAALESLLAEEVTVQLGSAPPIGASIWPMLRDFYQGFNKASM